MGGMVMGHYIDESTIKKPQYAYRASHPVITITDSGETNSDPCVRISNTRETTLWCEGCSAEGEWTQLKRVITRPYMLQVFHKDDGPNIATGKLIGDRKQLAAAFREGEDRQEEVVGYRPDYREASPAELMAQAASDDGLASQHDRAVQEGRKESKGRFVW